MNSLKKFALGALASLAMAAPAAASPSIVTALPDLSVLTTEVGRWIAEEWEGLRKVLLSVPHAARSERAAAVIIFEGPNHMIVTASRLTEKSDALTAQR
jgi:hypothetical protein